MYIEPFVAGVLATIFAELVFFFVVIPCVNVIVEIFKNKK